MERRVAYEHEGVALNGLLVTEDPGPRPAVLVFHGMEGRTGAQEVFVRRLAEQGYAGFAVDLFGIGEGELAWDDMSLGEQAMNAMLADRDLLLRRILHVLGVVRDLPEVEGGRIAALGFCFGGLCVLDLARSGADVRGVASFHGVLTAPEGATPGDVRAKVIVFHGWDDPLAPPEDVVALGKELTASGADWQVHAYGGAMHAFMAPTANNPEAGIRYDETSARRAWASLGPFLAEAFA